MADIFICMCSKCEFVSQDRFSCKLMYACMVVVVYGQNLHGTQRPLEL